MIQTDKLNDLFYDLMCDRVAKRFKNNLDLTVLDVGGDQGQALAKFKSRLPHYKFSWHILEHPEYNKVPDHGPITYYSDIEDIKLYKIDILLFDSVTQYFGLEYFNWKNIFSKLLKLKPEYVFIPRGCIDDGKTSVVHNAGQNKKLLFVNCDELATHIKPLNYEMYYKNCSRYFIHSIGPCNTEASADRRINNIIYENVNQKVHNENNKN